jgi:mannose-1-phosphate guanylyltransferase / phosphomannomutase
MILAAGRGTRLGRLGLTIPKVLLEVGGEPMLARHLRYLVDQGFHRVVINVHHLADRIESFVDGYRGPAEVLIVRERMLLGTAGGVRNALPHLTSVPFLVLYGDVLIDSPLNEMSRMHRLSGAEATIAAYPTTRPEGKGTLELDEDGLVRSFMEKPSVGGGGRTALVNAGVYFLEPSFIEEMTDAGVASDFGHDVFPAAITSGRRVFGHVLPQQAIDVGTPSGLRQARRRRWN